MKAVIVVPPVSDFYFTPRRWASLGAESVRRELASSGIDALTVDLPGTGEQHVIPLPPELAHLKPFIIHGERGPIAFHRRFSRYGPPLDDCVSAIAAQSPSMCFISCIAYCYVEETIELAVALKKLNPKLPIAVGGHAVAALPERFMRAESGKDSSFSIFDVVVAGEIEGLGTELVDVLRSSSQQFLDRRSVPEPAAPAYPVSRASTYRGKIPWISVSLSRGCPKGCSFCSNHLCHGTDYRIADPEFIEAEARKIASLPYTNPHITVEDDNILLSPDALFGFIDTVLKQKPGATFSAENGLDFRHLTPGMVAQLKIKNFAHLNLSLGAREPDRTLRELSQVIHAAYHHRLPATVHFICGMPGDTPESVVDTLVFLDALPSLIGISLFYPVPGLPGFSDPSVMLQHPPRRMMGSAAWPWTGALTTSQMVTAFRLARWSNARKAYESESGGAAVITRAPHRNGPHQTSVFTELVNEARRSRRISTVVRRGRQNEIVAVEGMDSGMTERFFKGIEE